MFTEKKRASPNPTFVSTLFASVPKFDHKLLVQKKKVAKFTPYNHNNPSNWSEMIARTLDTNQLSKTHDSRARDDLGTTKRIL
jgi:hypothetical protein